MLRHACQSVVENYPRPDDCDHCAAAWDRIAAAAFARCWPRLKTSGPGMAECVAVLAREIKGMRG